MATNPVVDDAEEAAAEEEDSNNGRPAGRRWTSRWIQQEAELGRTEDHIEDKPTGLRLTSIDCPGNENGTAAVEELGEDCRTTKISLPSRRLARCCGGRPARYYPGV